MTKNFRSGIDRRQQNISVEFDRRSGQERRSFLIDPDKTIGRLRMIHIFDGLSSEQLKNLLAICTKKNYSKNDVIFSIGDKPSFMVYFIKGKIRIVFKDGSETGGITPTEIIGEVGMFTDTLRSFSVIADISCTSLVFNKDELFRLFENDKDMWIIIQKNIIGNLQKKLYNDNEQMEEKRKIRSLELL
ncbi:MAG: cyclic nucleotide-binding domain-containing protein [Candidatus Latescibacteria bacterium]|nr:cyclic nucleotide-binding domain-containing protein [Candidatus Latescibacterota bacterium]